MAEITGRRRFAHLYRRAGFGATQGELDTAQALHPNEDTAFTMAVDNLLNYGSTETGPNRIQPLDPGGTPENNPVTSMAIWWLERMIHTSRPLLEKMTFFFHDHFATSVAKDGLNATNMFAQNETFRRNALGSFPQLLLDISKDPAMVFWLDLNTNRKDSPNENFARELFELFALGVATPERPNYSENDIKESTRAFTGYTVGPDGNFFFNAAQHAPGNKTVLGQTCTVGDQVITITCNASRNGRRLCADFMAWKLWNYFVYPAPITDAPIMNAANVFTNSGLSLRALVEAILKSPEFCSARAYRALYKSPVELAIGASRTLGAERMSWVGTYYRLYECGQRVLYPPDVNGWPKHRAWMNASTILSRANMNADLLNRLGQNNPDPSWPGGPEVHTLLNGFATPEAKLDRVLYLLLESDVPAAVRSALLPYAQQATSPEQLRGLFNMVMALAAYQLK